MKKYFIFCIVLFLMVAPSQSQTTKKVLFVGNSYTSRNDLPLLVKNMAASTNDVLVYDSNTPGGYRFLNHVTNATTLAKINANNWDYVVLQAQSQEASFSEAQMQTQLYPYATTLCDLIRANDVCSKPLFYMTWGRENGDASNCAVAPWLCTYEGMDDAIKASYEYMAAENNATLAPAGAVWRYLRTNHPLLNLYSSDSSHPSLAGSYAAACALYTLIYKKDPTLITWNALLSDEDASTIKMAAKTIVFDALTSLDFTLNPAVANFSEVITAANVSFTNTSNAYDTLLWDFGTGITSTEENPSYTYPTSGSYTVTLTVTKCGHTHTLSKIIAIDTTLGNEAFGIKNVISVYPNPTSTEFMVTLPHTYSNIQVVVATIMGSIVFEKEAQNTDAFSIQISSLKSGTYLIKVSADGAVYYSKVLKI